MKTSKTIMPFRKTATCPASATLLSFCGQSLPAETTSFVETHLAACDFCNAELPLLARHQPAGRSVFKTPEMPINLRILAESILSGHRFTRVNTDELKKENSCSSLKSV